MEQPTRFYLWRNPLCRNLTREEIEEAYEWNTGVLIADEFEMRKKDYLAVPAVCKNHGVFTWGAIAQKPYIRQS